MNKDNAQTLSQNCNNGRLLLKDTNEIFTYTETALCYENDGVYRDTTQIIDNMEFTFPTSFWTQFIVLLKRMMLQIVRNKSVLIMQSIHHVVSAIILGVIFCGIGNDAKMARSNFNFCLASMVFFVYTYAMVPVLSCKF